MKKKLIEVALPLEAINRESAREKSIRHGHPSTLHLWWARRPLAACRAVLFASLVDDPSSLPEEFPTEEEQEKERQRLFRIIEDLVKWDNSNNEKVLDAARKEILKSTEGNPPPVLDPFCGGGSIPLEAQRLGLEAHGSDLNPVAVLITKALVEIPSKFADQPPVNPAAQLKRAHAWSGAQGLADDVRYYGGWVRDEAEKRIGHLYPTVKLENGRETTVIAWLWARTVICPNPACARQMPLARSFALSTKKGREVYVEPCSTSAARVRFEIRRGKAPDPEGTVNRRGGRCVHCGTAVDFDHIRSTGRAGGMHSQLMAVVAEGSTSREYLSPTDEMELVATTSEPKWRPDIPLPKNPRDFKTPNYGMTTFAELFTPRQLVALTTFSDLVGEARERVFADAKTIVPDDGVGIDDGGTGARAYADAVATYLGICASKLAVFLNTMSRWRPGEDKSAPAFGRQAIPMVWDFADINPFAGAGGDFGGIVDGAAKVLSSSKMTRGSVSQRDARAAGWDLSNALVSTDPPYYDNIGYADLSDFFYVWLRRTEKGRFPSLFSTILTPKAQELIASPYRHDGDRETARNFFEDGFVRVFRGIEAVSTRMYPMTVFYAFKQSEQDEEGVAAASTGWETMLEGLLSAGWSVDATWPMRTEGATRMIARNTNSLASSVVLSCRQRRIDAAIATRKEFISALKRELPPSIKHLQRSSIAAVDLEQATIGPGMAVFSRYAKVIEADGSPMRVRSALQLINQAVDEVRSEQESEYDADTQWAVAWFDQFGMNEARFGEAETLSRAKNTSVDGLVSAGLLRAAKGKVQLLSRDELSAGWDPTADLRLTVWEVTQQLIRRLQKGGEAEAADLLRKVGGMGEVARDLAYRLYSVCERKGWTDEAIAYNSLIVAWPDITRIASEGSAPSTPEQGTFLR